MKQLHIHRETTPFFSNLSNDISYNNPLLNSFIQEPFSIASFENQIQKKSFGFSNEQRLTLVKQLEFQYKDIALNDAVVSNIQALKDKHTFTITTGHQLCVFGGPLYFFYKIIHAIRLAEDLSNRHKDKRFVPVFWMASEDHDFDEINHVHLFGKRVSWDTKQKGAVGRFNLSDIHTFKSELLQLFQNDIPTQNLIQSYFSEEDVTLACATRKFVHSLFSKYGLVIIDGDDPVLKRSFIPVFQKEIEEGFSFSMVDQTSQRLHELGYKTQVSPREINLFYLGEGRDRILPLDDHFVIGGEKMSMSEVIVHLNEFPEKFSPNVVLRPVYQEFVLPNLCYIGGGGEISYWLQLKGVFDACEIPFPLIQVRNSLQFIDPGSAKKISKFGLEVNDVFTGLDHLKAILVHKSAGEELNFHQLDILRDQLATEMTTAVLRVDEGLNSYQLSEITKLTNQLEGLKQKLVRQMKKKHETELLSLENMYNKLFPNGGLQERNDSIFSMIGVYGLDHFLSMVFDNTQPHINDLIVIHE